MKLAMADLEKYLWRPDFIKIPKTDCSRRSMRERRSLIDPQRGLLSNCGRVRQRKFMRMRQQQSTLRLIFSGNAKHDGDTQLHRSRGQRPEHGELRAEPTQLIWDGRIMGDTGLIELPRRLLLLVRGESNALEPGKSQGAHCKYGSDEGRSALRHPRSLVATTSRCGRSDARNLVDFRNEHPASDRGPRWSSEFSGFAVFPTHVSGAWQSNRGIPEATRQVLAARVISCECVPAWSLGSNAGIALIPYWCSKCRRRPARRGVCVGLVTSRFFQRTANERRSPTCVAKFYLSRGALRARAYCRS